MVVKEYLAGGISQQSLAKKHGILAPSTIGCWVKVYNNHEELTESRPKGSISKEFQQKTVNAGMTQSSQG